MQGGCCSFVLAREAFEMLVLGVFFTPICCVDDEKFFFSIFTNVSSHISIVESQSDGRIE
jgi:hypothetical protein